jgi:3-oxoacyl-[acyl-carrier-protein] synthase-3
VYVQGLGSYAPSRILANEELASIVDTSDEWIITRSGIRERHIAAPDETGADMAAKAAQAALADAHISPEDIDLLIVATVSDDTPVPSVACRVHSKIGLKSGVPAFDITAACSGFIYLLQIANHMLRAGDYRRALVIATEKLSRITDWTDRSTCVLFGDAAGAAVLAKCDIPHAGILGNVLGADGTKGDLLAVNPRNAPAPVFPAALPSGTHTIAMNGREVFKNAVRVMSQACRSVLAKCATDPAQLALIIPHQANIRIIEAISDELKIPLSRFKINLDRYGNTSAASIPLALDEAYRAGEIKEGDLVLLVAFGGGFTWGASLIRWQKNPEKTTPAL